jgi:hypothetical protein
MKSKELIIELNKLGLLANTFSFYVDENGEEQGDTVFGTCEISGIRGDIVGCTCLDKKGNVVYIEVGEWLVGGALGKLAGAF